MSTPATRISPDDGLSMPATQIEQRRFAGARRSHQRDIVALVDIEIDADQHGNDLVAANVIFREIAQGDQRLRRRRGIAPAGAAAEVRLDRSSTVGRRAGHLFLRDLEQRAGLHLGRRLHAPPSRRHGRRRRSRRDRRSWLRGRHGPRPPCHRGRRTAPRHFRARRAHPETRRCSGCCWAAVTSCDRNETFALISGRIARIDRVELHLGHHRRLRAVDGGHHAADTAAKAGRRAAHRA